MFKETLDKIRKEVSGQRALSAVGEIVRHHRIQASTGFRDAAHWCDQAFKRAGVASEIKQYPYDGHEAYWASRSFEEWDPQSASLELLTPESEAQVLCDYAELKMSVIQRSAPTPPDGVEAELVVVEAADKDESYEGLNVQGKLVVTSVDVESVRQLAVKQRGALGIVSDWMMEFAGVRSRWDLPDTHQYTSFWWPGADEPKCFGFVLTPRQGDWLRQLIRRENAAGRKVTARAKVKSSFCAGAIDNVEAVIPGTGSDEVLVVAHLCHPQHSANDNASGCAAAIEAARALADLIAKGSLQPPRRGIRFLLVPEFAGTYAFLARGEERIASIVAAINLDMVGQNQDLCGSSMLIEKPPRALGSFAGDLAELLLEALADDVANIAGSARYGLFRHSVTEFSGGSDHYILSDPTVGIPCPMIIQWPDRFYHTSADTIDKVDPASLARATSLTAAYAYFLAQASEDQVCWLAGEMAGIFAAQCAKAARIAILADDYQHLRERLSFLAERKTVDLDSLQRLVSSPSKAADEAIGAAAKRIHADLTSTLGHCERVMSIVGATPPEDQEDQAGGSRRPRRTFRGPVGRREIMGKLSPAEQAAWTEETTAYLQGLGKDLGKAFAVTTSALFWTDGRRTMAEIDHLVRMESGWSDRGLLNRVYELLEQQGLVEWVEG